MQNAHLRLGLLEYHRNDGEDLDADTNVRVDRYVGEDEQAHLISVFGNELRRGRDHSGGSRKGTFHANLPGRRNERGVRSASTPPATREP